MSSRTSTRSRQTTLSAALLLVGVCLAILGARLGLANASSSSIPKCHVPTLSKNLIYLGYEENPKWLQDMIAAKFSDESILEFQTERIVQLKKAMKMFARNQRAR